MEPPNKLLVVEPFPVQNFVRKLQFLELGAKNELHLVHTSSYTHAKFLGSTHNRFFFKRVAHVFVQLQIVFDDVQVYIQKSSTLGMLHPVFVSNLVVELFVAISFVRYR